MNVLVHRVEHPEDGYGPYNSVHNIDYLLDVHEAATGHPSAWHSFGRWPEYHEVFGFTTKKQLARWFKDYTQDLRDAGFVHAVYEVQESKITGPDQHGQVLFHRLEPHARLVTRKVIPCHKPRNRRNRCSTPTPRSSYTSPWANRSGWTFSKA